MSVGDYTKIATLSGVGAFRELLASLSITLPCDEELVSGTGSPLAQPLTVFGKTVGNRFTIQPMEGWDGTTDGRPSENGLRRWQRFGESGAKIIWGGEAVAVRPDGRANPNQLMINADTLREIARLRETLVKAHRVAMGTADDLLIGLQLTHSGRFARPNDKKRLEPRIAYRHPILDRKFGIPDDYPVLSDGDIRALIDDFVAAAKRAQACGYDFVDVKHCHGYLGHEFLSAFTREGDFGGSLENRTRFLREIVTGIRTEAPGLGIGVRVSAFDFVPYKPDPEQSLPGRLGPGIFEDYCDFMPYRYAFGVNQDQPTDLDLTETFALFKMFRALDIRFINVTAGSPYYNPHIQRPALYPPSDGYQPPEDPLIGVARQIFVVKQLKDYFPDFTLIGSAYTYLQEFLPHVAHAAVREGWVDSIGLGRMVLSYPELPRDSIAGAAAIQKKRLCRTFSDCTTAPRNGIVSGCYPLDAHYKKSPEAAELARVKKEQKTS